MDTATFDHDSFRGRNDDGSETTATWKALVNVDWTQLVDTNFRFRALVQNETGFAGLNHRSRIQYNLNGAGWVTIGGTTSVVQSLPSPNLTDGEDTTQQIGSGTHLGAPNDGVDEVDGRAGGLDTDFAGNDEMEFEWVVEIRGADVNNGDTVELRGSADGTAYDTYTKTASITVDKPGGGDVSLVGVSASTSGSSADLVLDLALGGTSPGVSGSTTDVVLDLALVGGSAGTSGASSELTIGGAVDLAGVSAGVSGVSTAALARDRAIDGTSAGVSGVSTADAVLDLALVGVVDGNSGASSELTIQGAVDLAGVADSTSGATGDLFVDLVLDGSSAGTSGTPTAALARDRGFVGVAAGASGSSADLGLDVGSVGVAAAVSGSTAALALDLALEAVAAGVSGSIAVLDVAEPVGLAVCLDASVGSQLVMDADVESILVLDADVNSVTAMDADVDSATVMDADVRTCDKGG